MPVRSDSVIGQIAGAARRRRPLVHVTVSPRLARFLIAAGAQPAVKADRVHEESPAGTPGARAAGLPEFVPQGRIRVGIIGHGRDLHYAYSTDSDAVRGGDLLARVRTLHLRSYDEARMIGDAFRDGNPVVIDLAGMPDRDARRLIDFSAGLIYGLRGTIQRVTDEVFLLTPANVAAQDAAVSREGQGREAKS